VTGATLWSPNFQCGGRQVPIGHFEASTAATKLEQRLSSFDNVEMTLDFVEGDSRGARATPDELEISSIRRC
jgi:hypothetical protein